MSLATGECLVQSRWTALPVPCEAQNRVNKFGNKQKMPKTLTFADRHGHEIQDNLEEVLERNDEDNETYEFQEDVDDEELSCGTMDDGVQNTGEKVATSASSIRELDHEDIPSIDSITIDEPADEVQDRTTPSENHGNTGVDGNDPPMADTIESAGVGEESPDEISIDSSVAVEDTEEADYQRVKRLGIESAQDDGHPLPGWTCKKKADEMYEYYNAMFAGIDIEHVFSTFDDGNSNDMFNFLTKQMSASVGLKEFGEQGAALIMKELEQLLYRKVIIGHTASSLSSSQQKAALQYLMFLKEKRCGKVKARGCADGRKQRLYKTKDETSSPTMNVEALFITCLIDAMEGREVMTCDIPGAFMQSDMDELLHMKLEGEIAFLLICLHPSYKQFLTYEQGKPVIYTELSKALYDTLQVALLFWRNLA